MSEWWDTAATAVQQRRIPTICRVDIIFEKILVHSRKGELLRGVRERKRDQADINTETLTQIGRKTKTQSFPAGRQAGRQAGRLTVVDTNFPTCGLNGGRVLAAAAS
jgi:hypothetical protein